MAVMSCCLLIYQLPTQKVITVFWGINSEGPEVLTEGVFYLKQYKLVWGQQSRPWVFAGALLCGGCDENRLSDFNSWRFISKPGPTKKKKNYGKSELMWSANHKSFLLARLLYCVNFYYCKEQASSWSKRVSQWTSFVKQHHTGLSPTPSRGSQLQDCMDSTDRIQI